MKKKYHVNHVRIETKTAKNARNVPNFSKPSNFEDAITATGFGKFNVLLMFIVIPCSFAQVAEQLAVAFVVPIAQCDLELSLQDKGILNSAGYIGMMTTGILWGYICDTYGRRKVIICGYLFNSLFLILAALSRSFPMFLATRICSGIMFTGPFSAVASYLSEFHSTSTRAKMHLIRGMAGALALICLPLLAWAILPSTKTYVISSDIEFKAWHMFYIVCSLPALMSSIIFIFMPESPRYLMTQGKNDEALHVFEMVHRINTGKSDCYPVKNLIVEKDISSKTQSKNLSMINQLTNGLKSVKPLFCRPYIFNLMHACFNAFCLVIGVFGLKLWYPQILQTINDNQKIFGNEITICNVVESLTAVKNSTNTECTVNLDNSSVYINSIISGSVNLSVFILASVAVNALGKKTLVACSAFVASLCPLLIYFFSNATVMLVLFPITLAIGELGANVLLTVTLEIFPTAFRLTALNIHLTCVRTAIVVGNIIFPTILMTGCISFLLFISMFIFVAVALTSFLPTTENKALQ